MEIVGPNYTAEGKKKEIKQKYGKVVEKERVVAIVISESYHLSSKKLTPTEEKWSVLKTRSKFLQ